jgi:hypothetical protein
MYYNPQHYSVKLSVFFMALCETAIAQRLDKSDRNPYHYCFSTH